MFIFFNLGQIDNWNCIYYIWTDSKPSLGNDWLACQFVCLSYVFIFFGSCALYFRWHELQTKYTFRLHLSNTYLPSLTIARSVLTNSVWRYRVLTVPYCFSSTLMPGEEDTDDDSFRSREDISGSDGNLSADSYRRPVHSTSDLESQSITESRCRGWCHFIDWHFWYKGLQKP